MTIQVGGITLNGIDLNNSLQWTDRFDFTSVIANSVRTLGGGLVVYEQAISHGRPITLEATTDTGWLTYGMVTALKALADASGATYALDFHGEIHSVRFEHGGQSVRFSPLLPKVTYDNNNDWFIGTMKLFTVA